MFTFKLERYLQINSQYLELHKAALKRIQNQWDQNHLHLLLLNYLKLLTNYLPGKVYVFSRNRTERSAWKNAHEASTTLLKTTKKVDEMFLKHAIYLFRDEHPITAHLSLSTKKGRVEIGLLFSLFKRFEYLILAEKRNHKTEPFFEFLAPTLEDLYYRLQLTRSNFRWKERVKLLEMELNKIEGDLEQTNKSLKKRAYEIDNLLEISNEIYSILDLEQLVNAALLILVGQIGCQKAFALLLDTEKGKYSRQFVKGFVEEFDSYFELELDAPLISYFRKNYRPKLISELQKQKELKENLDRLQYENIDVIAPIIYSNRIKGIIGIGNKLYGSTFDKSDMQIFNILVNIISVSISNAEMYENTKKMSLTDAMTHLYNYRYLEQRMNEELKRARRSSMSVSVLMIDIDHFKNYNDQLGHQAGDEALRIVAQLLQNTLREEDVVARYGGEEFCVILPNTAKDQIAYLAERVRLSILNHSFYREEIQPERTLTISMGGASFPDDGDDFKGLIKRADTALYQSKQNGRNMFTLYRQEAVDSVG